MNWVLHALWLFFFLVVFDNLDNQQEKASHNTDTFLIVSDSTLATNEDLSKLHSTFTKPLASCYVIANDTLSAIAEAISKMRNVQIIHKFTRINDTLYYMELSKLKEPNED